jgi:hypothetical protein
VTSPTGMAGGRAAQDFHRAAEAPTHGERSSVAFSAECYPEAVAAVGGAARRGVPRVLLGVAAGAAAVAAGALAARSEAAVASAVVAAAGPGEAGGERATVGRPLRKRVSQYHLSI